MTLHLGPPASPKVLVGKQANFAQIGVLPWRRRKGEIEVCLVTSRRSGRWIVPKGWPMEGRTPAEAAAIEAWEEAGLTGTVSPDPLGVYGYVKQYGGAALPIIAVLFAMRVRQVADDFPESQDRKRVWLKPKKAAARLAEPELARIVRKFTRTKARS